MARHTSLPSEDIIPPSPISMWTWPITPAYRTRMYRSAYRPGSPEPRGNIAPEPSCHRHLPPCGPGPPQVTVRGSSPSPPLSHPEEDAQTQPQIPRICPSPHIPPQSRPKDLEVCPRVIDTTSPVSYHAPYLRCQPRPHPGDRTRTYYHAHSHSRAH